MINKKIALKDVKSWADNNRSVYVWSKKLESYLRLSDHALQDDAVRRRISAEYKADIFSPTSFVWLK